MSGGLFRNKGSADSICLRLGFFKLGSIRRVGASRGFWIIKIIKTTVSHNRFTEQQSTRSWSATNVVTANIIIKNNYVLLCIIYYYDKNRSKNASVSYSEPVRRRLTASELEIRLLVCVGVFHPSSFMRTLIFYAPSKCNLTFVNFFVGSMIASMI